MLELKDYHDLRTYRIFIINVLRQTQSASTCIQEQRNQVIKKSRFPMMIKNVGAYSGEFQYK